MLNPAGDSPERVTCLSTSITKSVNEQMRKKWKRRGKVEEHREQGVRAVTEEWAKPGKTGSGFHEEGGLGYGVGGDMLRSLLQRHQRNTASFPLSDDIDLQHCFGTSFPLLGRGLYSMEPKGTGSRSF